MLAGPQAPAAPANRQAAPAASRRIEPAALVLLLVLAIVWSWWAAKDGAFFETVLLPGTILLCATTALLAWAAPWRASLRPSQPATIALASLTGLGAWAALSALWSPVPDVAIEDGQRILTYALAFGLGIWLCNLLAGRLHLALVPLAIAGAFAGIVAVAGMLTSDQVGRYLDDGTLEFPLGYRNANAAFFAIALWPALGLASHRSTAWPVRAARAGDRDPLSRARDAEPEPGVPGGRRGGAVCLSAASRRTGPAGWGGWRSPSSRRFLILPALIDLYRAGDRGCPAALGARRAARGGARGRVHLRRLAGRSAPRPRCSGRRIPASPRRAEIANRAALAGLVAAVLAGSIVFVVAVGNPADWIDKRVSQLVSGRGCRAWAASRAVSPP